MTAATSLKTNLSIRMWQLPTLMVNSRRMLTVVREPDVLSSRSRWCQWCSPNARGLA